MTVRSNNSLFNIIVVSQPSTGTTFCLKFMELLGFVPGKNLSRIHVGLASDAPGIPNEMTRIIIPQRDPIKAFHTVNQKLDKHHDKNSPNREGPPDTLLCMIRAYEQLDELRTTHTTLTLPVDVSPMPRNFWRDFATFLNIDPVLLSDIYVLDFIHTWKPVNTKPHNYPHHSVPKEIIELSKQQGYSTLNDSQS